MLVASRERSPVWGGTAWQAMPARLDGPRGWPATPAQPLCTGTGAPMENGTAGRGASPPPQPTAASPSDRWSQAWAENFPGAAAHGSGAMHGNGGVRGDG